MNNEREGGVELGSDGTVIVGHRDRDVGRMNEVGMPTWICLSSAHLQV